VALFHPQYGGLSVSYEQQGESFPYLKRAFEAIRQGPAVQRALGRTEKINAAPTVSEESNKFLFGQMAAVVAAMNWSKPDMRSDPER
jgi:hypothetical protein